MTILARLDLHLLDPQAELAGLLESAGEDGAIASFVGVARRMSSAGEAIEQLVLEHHPRLTAPSLQQIAEDAAGRFPVSHVRVVHRHGTIQPGEPIVFAGAAAPHRRAALEAVDYLMDRLKTEAVFWKREDGPTSSTWIEPTDADHLARRRWE